MFFVWSVHNQNYMKKVTKGNILRISLQRFFLSVHFYNIFGLFWAKHCIVWKLTDIDISMKRILNSVFASFYSTWIKSIRCGGFECPINDSTYIRVRTKIKLIVVFWQFFFVSWVRTASKVDLLAIFLLQKILADKVNLSYKAAFKY